MKVDTSTVPNRLSLPINKAVRKFERVARIDTESNNSKDQQQCTPTDLAANIISAISEVLFTAEIAVFTASVAFVWMVTIGLRRRRLTRRYDLPLSEPQIDR